MTQNEKPKILWVYKGTSNFCSELVMADDYETLVRQKPEGFYDVVSERDTIEGGIKMIEHRAYLAIQQELEEMTKERDAYAQAMAIALREGIFFHKQQVKDGIDKVLAKYLREKYK